MRQEDFCGLNSESQKTNGDLCADFVFTAFQIV
jgi:hypothetical protein